MLDEVLHDPKMAGARGSRERRAETGNHAVYLGAGFHQRTDGTELAPFRCAGQRVALMRTDRIRDGASVQQELKISYVIRSRRDHQRRHASGGARIRVGAQCDGCFGPTDISCADRTQQEGIDIRRCERSAAACGGRLSRWLRSPHRATGRRSDQQDDE